MNTAFSRTLLAASISLLLGGCSALTKHKTGGEGDLALPSSPPASIDHSGVNQLFDEATTGSTNLEDYEYTVNWRKLMPGGAALNTSGYVHVLAYSDPRCTPNNNLKASHQRELWDQHPSPATNKPEKTPPKRFDSVLASAEPQKKPVKDKVDKPTPKYIVDAYRRYCNNGIGMTDQDWDVVTNNGYANGVPPEVTEECVPPK